MCKWNTTAHEEVFDTYLMARACREQLMVYTTECNEAYPWVWSSHIKVLNFSIQNITGVAIHHLPSFPLTTDWNRIKCSEAPYAWWNPVWQETATMLIDIPAKRTVCHPPVHIHYYHRHFEVNWSTISATTIQGTEDAICLEKTTYGLL